MDKQQEIIANAVATGIGSLDEHLSKEFLACFGIPVVPEVLVSDVSHALAAASDLGYPVVLKACSAGLAHKSELGLIAVGLSNEEELKAAFAELSAKAGEQAEGFLVQKMLTGSRELVIGLSRDEQFGPCVMFGLGGVFTEILDDVSFRVAPLSEHDAQEMMQEIRAKKILEDVRGMGEVDLESLAASLKALGRIGLEHPEIAEIDVNPLIVEAGRPVAVDALVVLAG